MSETLQGYIQQHGIWLGSHSVLLLEGHTLTYDYDSGGVFVYSPETGKLWRAHSVDELFWLNKVRGERKAN